MVKLANSVRLVLDSGVWARFLDLAWREDEAAFGLRCALWPSFTATILGL